MNNQERIGKVTLDYQFYPGQDFYSEGNIEDKLLKLAEEKNEKELYTLINTENKWEYLYHFSQFRKNIVNWIPFKDNAKVLEIGSGCGAITGTLAEKGGQVDCVELSRKRSLINANRNRNYENITIKVGNFEEIEPYLDADYDVITLIGVWEYAGVYLTADEPFGTFLDLLRKHIKDDGKIIIAIENRFGLKYWAGCREDHTAKFFEGLEGYTDSNSAVTFGRNEMIRLFKEKNYYYQFYYPYPDYKIPFQIFSDEYLPQRGMLGDNNKNFDNSRMVLFDEEKVYNSIIDNDMFPFFSNSFLVTLSKNSLDNEERVIYSKFSNERVENFQIRTDIIKNEQGKKIVRKIPLDSEAVTHVQNIFDLYQTLQKNNQNKDIIFNVCEKEADCVRFEYVEGENVEETLRKLLLQGRVKQAENLIDEIVNWVHDMTNTTFTETEEFRNVFGECSLEGVPAVNGADIDITFGNIICQNGKWNILDYEWTYLFPVPTNYILYRLLYDQASDEIRQWGLCEKYGISDEERKIYYQMERHFMAEYVYKDRYVLSGSQIIKPKFIINEDVLRKNIESGSAVKVYYDYGDGLSEMNVNYFPCKTEGNSSIDIPINDKTVHLRIDPMECSGIVHLENVKAYVDKEEYAIEYNVNGVASSNQYFVYDTEDPWIYFPNIKPGTTSIHLNIRIDKVSRELIDEVVRQNKELKKEREIKVYYDYGQGFSEKNTASFFYASPQNIVVDIPITETVSAIRIDPMEAAGVVQMNKISAVAGEKEYKPDYRVNGNELGNHCYIYATEDPWIFINDLKKGTNCVHIEMGVGVMAPDLAESISRSCRTNIKKIQDNIVNAVRRTRGKK